MNACPVVRVQLPRSSGIICALPQRRTGECSHQIPFISENHHDGIGNTITLFVERCDIPSVAGGAIYELKLIDSVESFAQSLPLRMLLFANENITVGVGGREMNHSPTHRVTTAMRQMPPLPLLHVLKLPLPLLLLLRQGGIWHATVTPTRGILMIHSG
jgi:hypothetical protein